MYIYPYDIVRVAYQKAVYDMQMQEDNELLNEMHLFRKKALLNDLAAFYNWESLPWWRRLLSARPFWYEVSKSKYFHLK